MLEFVFTIILMASLSVVLYLMARALPRLAEDASSEEKSLLDRWAHSEIPEKVDATLNGFLLKLLRRVRVLVLKLDNALNNHLKKIRHEENDKKPNIDFKEISGQNKESEDR